TGDLTQASGSLIDGGTGDVMLSAGTDAKLGRVTTAGAVSVSALGGSVELADALSTSGGSVEVTAETDVVVAATGSVAGANGVSLTATTGGLTQASGSLIDGGTGDVMLSAGTDATIGQVKTAGAGTIGITAV
ncbi:hypothetical protein, partial [Rhizobium sp. CSW-27]|uniref:hypothetical protein n=1 Tax=Rhizobium sp. CSW-27 TaxID=2839985 RepID=UPI001C01AA08